MSVGGPALARAAARTRDVAVVGAGPAGGMAAWQARRRGLSVVLVERQPLPRWKVCGACLSPECLRLLDEAGLGGLPAEMGAVPLHHMRLGGWQREARVRLCGSVALARSALDGAIAAAARSRGAALLTGMRARLGEAEPDRRRLHLDGREGAVTLRARVVVCAAGLSGLPSGGHERIGSTAAPGSRVGLGAVFDQAPEEYEPGVVHMAVGEPGYVGLVRLRGGGLNVAAALDPGRLRGLGSPGRAVGAVLRGAGFAQLPGPPALGWKGTPTLTRTPGKPSARVLTIGDSAGYVEPFTGEGMAWALADATASAPFVERAVGAWTDDLESEWRAAQERRRARAERLCRAVAWGSRRRWLALAVLGVLGRFPGAAAPFVRSAAGGRRGRST